MHHSLSPRELSDPDPILEIQILQAMGWGLYSCESGTFVFRGHGSVNMPSFSMLK